jgi:mRNA-degrading endonuclease YafQ of YafQ-DinJ toxin-antitoxin module
VRQFSAVDSSQLSSASINNNNDSNNKIVNDCVSLLAKLGSRPTEEQVDHALSGNYRDKVDDRIGSRLLSSIRDKRVPSSVVLQVFR